MELYGVEPICKVLQVAPSAYRRYAARCRQPQLRSQRAQKDEQLRPQIYRVWEQSFCVYGARKVWKQMNRESIHVARCTVERLMGDLGIEGVRRGKRVRTTVPDSAAACPQDLVRRHFEADRPNRLWVADFTYVSTWQGWLYVAFVIDAYTKRIVGWRASSSMTTDFVLDALEQAVYDRRPSQADGLIHYSHDAILSTFRLIDWMLILPPEQEQAFIQAMQSMSEERNMPFVTSIERHFLARGKAEGIAEGKTEGMLSILRHMLTRKFGPLPEWADARLAQADPDTLALWSERILFADSLEDIFETQN